MRSDILQELPATGLAAKPVVPPHRATGHERRETTPPAVTGPALAPLLSPASLLFCLANGAALTAFLGSFLQGQQLYNDLISGSLIWTNADKGFDFRLFYVFLAVSALFWMVLGAVANRLPNTSAIRKAQDRLLILSLTPGALWLGTRLATNSFGTVPAGCAACGLAMLMLLPALSRRRLNLTAVEIESIGHTILLTLLLAFFSGLGLATLISRTWGPMLQPNVGARFAGIACAAVFLVALTIIVISPTGSNIRQRLRHLVYGAQLLLPLLCAVVIPPAIVVNRQLLIPNPSWILNACLILLMATGWVWLIRRWRKSADDGDANVTHHLTLFSVLPIAIFIAVNHGQLPTFIGDDFHLGEHLLPWQQLRDFGKLPFVDFVPVHPLMDLLVGAANDVFFDGTLANYENSRMILFAMGAGLTFVAAYRFGGAGIALCLAMAGSVWDRLLFVPAAVAMLCHRSLLSRPAPWLVGATFVCFLSCFYNPAAGIALTLAIAPIAIFQFWQLVAKERKILVRIAAVFGLSCALVGAIPACRTIGWGFVRFLVDNGRTVVIAHGAEWQIKAGQMLATKGILAVPILWEGLRFSWIIVLAISAAIFVRRAARWRKAAPETLMISGVVCLFLLFLAKWTLNRIDAFNPSRTGEVSFLACLYLLPLVLVANRQWRHSFIPIFVFGVAFFQQSFGAFVNSGSKPHLPWNPRALMEKAAGPIVLPPNSVLVDGPALGLPNLGKIYAPAEWLASKGQLYTAVSDLLRPGETFFDLTNRQANYFYLGLPVASSYGAPWLAANSALQDRIIHELSVHPPPLVWAAPPMTHDNGTASLRTYKIYRFVVQRYLPIVRGQNLFMITPERAGGHAPSAEKQMELLQAAFDNPNLAQLPSAWGSSWSLLAHRFSPTHELRLADSPVTHGAAVSLGKDLAALDGLTNDFLKFDLASNLLPNDRMDLEISWTGDYGRGTARLSATEGTNLVPLGAFPAWLLSRRITDVQIRPLSPPDYLHYAVRNAELLQLKN